MWCSNPRDLLGKIFPSHSQFCLNIPVLKGPQLHLELGETVPRQFCAFHEHRQRTLPSHPLSNQICEDWTLRPPCWGNIAYKLRCWLNIKVTFSCYQNKEVMNPCITTIVNQGPYYTLNRIFSSCACMLGERPREYFLFSLILPIAD